MRLGLFEMFDSPLTRFSSTSSAPKGKFSSVQEAVTMVVVVLDPAHHGRRPVPPANRYHLGSALARPISIEHFDQALIAHRPYRVDDRPVEAPSRKEHRHAADNDKDRPAHQ